MVSPLVLGIETSCDETGVGLVRGHDLLADAVASSVDEQVVSADQPDARLVAGCLDAQHQGRDHYPSTFRMTTASTPDGW